MESSPGRLESGVDIRNSLVLVLSFGSRGKKGYFSRFEVIAIESKSDDPIYFKIKGCK